MLILRLKEQTFYMEGAELYIDNKEITPSYEITIHFTSNPLNQRIEMDQIVEMWSVPNTGGISQYFLANIRSVQIKVPLGELNHYGLTLQILGDPPFGMLSKNEVEEVKEESTEAHINFILEESK